MAPQDLINDIDHTIVRLQAERARLVQKQQEISASQGFANPYKRLAFRAHTKQCVFAGDGHISCGFGGASDFSQVDWSTPSAAEYLRQAAEFVQLVQAGGGTVSL